MDKALGSGVDLREIKDGPTGVFCERFARIVTRNTTVKLPVVQRDIINVAAVKKSARISLATAVDMRREVIDGYGFRMRSGSGLNLIVGHFTPSRCAHYIDYTASATRALRTEKRAFSLSSL